MCSYDQDEDVAVAAAEVAAVAGSSKWYQVAPDVAAAPLVVVAAAVGAQPVSCGKACLRVSGLDALLIGNA